MSEEEVIEYKNGDIVWVKLGTSWWPGEVTDNAPEEDLGLKKAPIAIVKFFDEDNFEYVNNPKSICPYNCDRKIEFIKKGMDAYRAKNIKFEKFPLDINTAETKTDGNINILYDVYSQKKTNIVAEIFGTGSPKKTPKNPRFKLKSSSVKKRKSLPQHLIAKGVTHRRFLGCDDYEMRIRVQYPGKDEIPRDSDDESEPLSEIEAKTFPCSICKFQTNRLEVMLFHVQCHIKGLPIANNNSNNTNSSTTRKSSPIKKAPKKVKKSSLVDEDEDNDNDFDSNNENSDISDKPKQKRKRKSQNTSGSLPLKPKTKKSKQTEEEKPSVDIRTDLLAEWSDSDDKEDLDTTDLNQSLNSSKESLEKISDITTEEVKEKITTTDDKEEKQKQQHKDDLIKSCFDFEEEEEDSSILQASGGSGGRKIPRVIPPSERRKSSPTNSDSLIGDDSNSASLTTPATTTIASTTDVEGTTTPTITTAEFEELMESTVVPSIPDVPDKEKFPQNFHSAKTIKFPDKSESPEKPQPLPPPVPPPDVVATKLTNPKKRFAKSFEEFELLQNEQRKAMEEIEINLNNEKANSVKIDENQKKDEITKPIETVITTEEKIVEETPQSQPPPPLPSTEDIQNESIEAESMSHTDNDQKLEISKLKSQIMSKISEEEIELQKKTTRTHRSPRSKILETYRNDTNRRISNEEKEKEKEKEKDLLLQKKEKQPPKKSSRYLRSNLVEQNEDDLIKKDEEPLENLVDENLFKSDDDKNVENTKLNEDVTKTDISKNVEETKIIENVDDKKEELSGLSTLADVSQLKTNYDSMKSSCQSEAIETGGQKIISSTTTVTPVPETSSGQVIKDEQHDDKNKDNNKKIKHHDEDFNIKMSPPPPLPPLKSDTELIQIDGNLTVVSEKDLADGQVEITAGVSPTHKKPVTLTNFSMDFSDDSSSTSNIEKSETNIVKKNVISINKDRTEILDDICDLEEHIPSQIVVANATTPELTVKKSDVAVDDKLKSSKLLERLTTNSNKDVIKSTKYNNKTDVEPKVPIQSTSTITSTTTANVNIISTTIVSSPALTTLKTNNSSTTSTTSSMSSNNKKVGKAIILSEQIVKPEKPLPGIPNASSVSVQRITSKCEMQDADEIDTFIIQKANNTETASASSDTMSSDDDVVMKKSKTLASDIHKKQVIAAVATKKRAGRAKILQQTIITPSGEIIQPSVKTVSGTTTSTTAQSDDNIFDINSMPIVLSDEILTPESIENMPIFLTDEQQLVAATITPTASNNTITAVKQTTIKKTPQPPMKILNKSILPTSLIGDKSSNQKIVKTTRVIGTVGSKIIKQNSFPPGSSSKHGKYVIVSQPSQTSNVVVGQSSVQSKYTVGKRVLKRPASDLTSKTSSVESTGNKIMILTNQQGQQQRVLLTPAHQKLMGYTTTTPNTSKITKTIVKGNIIQKTKDGQLITGIPGTSGLITKTVVSSSGGQRLSSGQSLITSTGQILTPIHQKQQLRTIVGGHPQIGSGQKLQMRSQKVPLKAPQQKTILIKNQHGQTVRKIQGTDEELLNKQVKEQIEAIKASGALHQKPEILNYKSASPANRNIRRTFVKKTSEESPRLTPSSRTQLIIQNTPKSETNIPPLAPISPKKPQEKERIQQQQQQQKVINESIVKSTSVEAATLPSISTSTSPSGRPLNQLVIQDAMGNQTTITEGQILALPSETIDGQPQSYMLVTLDESGNLTPLNNEALMSLDPNLGLSGDLGNTVLQIDQSMLKDSIPSAESAVSEAHSVTTTPTTNKSDVTLSRSQQQQQQSQSQPQLQEKLISNEIITQPTVDVNATVAGGGGTVTGNTGGQQLIVTGDPVAAQKFLESLTEGNTDLANILMSAEGSILVHADGQQILINTDSDNQMLLSMGEGGEGETSEGGGNPIFATTQPPTVSLAPSKNQDILAAALADTDVFQQDHEQGVDGDTTEHGDDQSQANKLIQSQSSPNSALYPMNVGNVLETSLTLNSPIMTPLEVPSTNSKKISDENDILAQVPKNVDLPITITDPNISQTVSQQQVASMIANDLQLQNNLELAIPLQSIAESSTSEMNSPSFVYSLPMPSLDESDQDILKDNKDTFNASMPLLTSDQPDDEIITSKSSKISNNLIIAKDDNKVTEESISTTTTTVTTIESTVDSSTSTTANTTTTTTKIEDELIATEVETTKVTEEKISAESFLDDNEGLCTLGGEMCSSLSEPPPDMFDLAAVLTTSSSTAPSTTIQTLRTNAKVESAHKEVNDELEESKIQDDKIDGSLTDQQSNPDTTTTTTTSTVTETEISSPPNSLNDNDNENEDSCEIPLQPDIVTSLNDINSSENDDSTNKNLHNNKQTSSSRLHDDDDDDDGGDVENLSKKCKFDNSS